MKNKLLLLALLASCAKKPLTGAAVGAVCSHDSDCQSGLFCEVRIPGGMCTKDCTPCPEACSSDCPAGCDQGAPLPCVKGCIPANQLLCPDGADCAQALFPNATLPEYRCLGECDVARPCRTDTTFTCCPETGDSLCVPGESSC